MQPCCDVSKYKRKELNLTWARYGAVCPSVLPMHVLPANNKYICVYILGRVANF